jgi:hypothetical protein
MMSLVRILGFNTARFSKLVLALFTVIASQLSYAGVWGEGNWGTMKWGANAAAAQCNAYGTSGAYVQKIFIAYLGRPPAPAGLQYYANFLDGNEAQGKLILFDDLYYSAEAEALYNNRTLGEKINQFYQFMFGRDALQGGLDYWIGQIGGGFVTVPESAAVIADSATGDGAAALTAKQIAATKLTCAIGDDAAQLTAFQGNAAGARASLATITTAEQAAAYDGEAALTQITGLNTGFVPVPSSNWGDMDKREVGREAREMERDGGADATPIPTLSKLVLFLLSGLVGLFGVARLKRNA